MGVIRKINLRSNLNQFIQTGLIVAILSTSILFLGGSHIYAQLLIRTLILILSGITAWNVYNKKNDLHDVKNNVIWATLFFGLYLAYLIIQQSNWSQHINSYDPYITYRNIIQLLYYYLFFLCCLLGFSHRENTRVSLIILSLLAVAVSVLGIYQKIAGMEKIYGFVDVGGGFFATFPYENNFGGFICLTLPAMIWIAAYEVVNQFRLIREDRSSTAWHQILIKLFDSKAVFFLFGSGFVLAAAFISNSRGAVFSMLACYSITLAILLFITKKKRVAILILLFGLVILFGLHSISSNQNYEQYDLSHIVDSLTNRLVLYSSSWELFNSDILFGNGLGNFSKGITKYLTITQEHAQYVHANNDYLELLCEVGVVGFVLIFASLSLIIVPSIFGFLKRHSSWLHALGGQAIVAIFSIGLASTGDSHLRLMSLALLFIFQLALLQQASNIIIGRSRDHLKSHAELHRSKVLRTVILGLFVVLILVCSIDLYKSQKVVALSKYGRNNADMKLIDQTIKIRPTNATLYAQAADIKIQMWKSNLANKALADEYLSDALYNQKLATKYSPYDAFYYFTLSQLQYYSGDRENAIKSIEQAIDLAPYNRQYRLHLVSIFIKESKRTMSSVRRGQYWDRAKENYRFVHELKKYDEERAARLWMMDFDADTYKRLIADIEIT